MKYPNVKIALSEGGTSWIPGFLDRMERQFQLQKWMRSDLGGLTPTEKFRRHFLALLHLRSVGPAAARSVGIDNIAYEVDYPHSDCSFPGLTGGAVGALLELATCSDAEIAKIGYENALRWLRFDPFVHVPRAKATVGALRASAVGVDLRTRSKAEYRKAYEAAHGPIA